MVALRIARSIPTAPNSTITMSSLSEIFHSALPIFWWEFSIRNLFFYAFLFSPSTFFQKKKKISILCGIFLAFLAEKEKNDGEKNTSW